MFTRVHLKISAEYIRSTVVEFSFFLQQFLVEAKYCWKWYLEKEWMEKKCKMACTNNDIKLIKIFSFLAFMSHDIYSLSFVFLRFCGLDYILFATMSKIRQWSFKYQITGPPRSLIVKHVTFNSSSYKATPCWSFGEVWNKFGSVSRVKMDC